jgi:hypothetical protein
MCILQKEDLNFVVGMRVRALGDIVDGIDGTPDPTAGPAEPGWTFAVHGDLGTVEYVNGYGDPTVRFDRTGTASICSPWELDIVPTATDARLPFPQADNPLRVMEVVDAVIDGHRTGQQLTGHFGFDERQSYYYGRAACLPRAAAPGPRWLRADRRRAPLQQSEHGNTESHDGRRHARTAGATRGGRSPRLDRHASSP